MRYKLMIAVLVLVTNFCFATSITFTFAHGQITGTSPQYYEFDVMAQAGASGTKIGDNLVYINYNTLGFGSSIVANNKITVTRGVILQGSFYDLVINDNSSSRVSLATEYLLPTLPSFANDLPSTPDTLLHVKIEIADPSKTSGLSFQQSLMTGQQYESDNSTQYSPVNASDTDDSSLPVELASFSASVVSGEVQLTWVTESEVNNIGFELFRSDKENGQYDLVSSYTNNPELEGQFNSNTRTEYEYIDDIEIEEEQTIWYKLVDVDINGVRTEHGPISVLVTPNAIPKEAALYPNYPNPFNPSTRLRYDVPGENGDAVSVRIEVFNILGQKVKTLFNGKIEPGSHEVTWNGTSDAGNLVAAGIYYAVFSTGNARRSIKMVFTK